MRKTIILLVVLVCAGYAIRTWHVGNRASYYREEAKVDHKIGQMHVGNTAKLEDETNPKLMKQWVKDVDVASFTGAILPSATRSAGLDNAKDAWLSRAQRKIPLRRDPYVTGAQNAWKTFFPAHEDILVTVGKDDQICNGERINECYHADGPYTGFKPSIMDEKKTVMQDPDPKHGGNPSSPPGNYRALIARISQRGGHTAIVETGFQFAICGASAGAGDTELWTNGATIIGPSHNVQDFWGGSGGYSFEAKPDRLAMTACLLRPGQPIVPLDSLATLSTMAANNQ